MGLSARPSRRPPPDSPMLIMALPERERNIVRFLFTGPHLRSLYPEWERLARTVVSYMRMEAARKPDDPRLAELVGDLRSGTRSSASGGPAPPGREEARHAALQPSRRRRDHARLGCAHLGRRAGPAARVYTAEPGSRSEISLTYRPRRTTPSDASVPDVWCSLTVPLCAPTPAVARRSPCK